MTLLQKEKLIARKKEIEFKIEQMRKRRLIGMDDDFAEDIVENLYRELLEIEKFLAKS